MLLELRWGPSSLYTFLQSSPFNEWLNYRSISFSDLTANRQPLTASLRTLSSGLQSLESNHLESDNPGSPNLTPFTPAVSEPGAQTYKSLASTNFATRAGGFGRNCKRLGENMLPFLK